MPAEQTQKRRLARGVDRPVQSVGVQGTQEPRIRATASNLVILLRAGKDRRHLLLRIALGKKAREVTRARRVGLTV